jgi:hypothetical protein
MPNNILESCRLTGEVRLGDDNWTRWACEHGQIIKIRLSDGSGVKTILLTAKIGLCRSRFDGFLGNARPYELV